MRLGLVADDVTGASDASVQFAKRGWDTYVSWGLTPVLSRGGDADVLAVTTDSRALSNDEAKTLTFDAVMALIETGIDRVFLKIDSTMRGSVQGQIAGALAAWRGRHPEAKAIVCPAYPRMGRTVQENRLLVHGEPVETTAIGRDPVTPVKTSLMSVLIPASPSITLADAASDDGLNALAVSIAAAGPSVIAVGSGGLAEALADVWTSRGPAADWQPAIQLHRGNSSNPRILLLVTSLNPVSHVQVARLIEACPDIEVVLAPAERVGGSSVAETLATEFSTLVDGRKWDLLGLIGGDGARAALNRLGASGMRIVGSVVEGIPIGVIIGGRADGMPVFTKAGGFGADDALIKAIERVSGRPPLDDSSGRSERSRGTRQIMMKKPVLAVTLGDVAGIGPEITAKTLLGHPDLRHECVPVVIGDADAMRRGIETTGGDPQRVRIVDDPSQASNDPNYIDLIQVGSSLKNVPVGEQSAAAGDAGYRFVIEACDLAKAGKVNGIVTAPLNKSALHAAGHRWPGHTELLAHEFGVKNFSLVLSAGDLYFFHLTAHVSLMRAIANITPERTDAMLDLADAFGRALGWENEPIGVAGLNPHAGEGGLFGTEDAEVLAPAIARAQRRGVNAAGPIPADALIPAAVNGRWRLVVICYHDQGHAPFKAVFGHNGVNITAGLPVVRVSVDHGTAFDIAGKGLAREDSLVLSCRRAAQLAPGWRLIAGERAE